MVVKITQEDVGRVVRALNLKRGIEELRKQIVELQRRKAELEEEYQNLGVEIE